ncbi:tropomodulin-3 [Eurytemora carolleeae]|uniref:tropomodulin-3 n=1 Tax=Eurytemora carolleeae TaxID=1294199 RepID=UPI000C787838|nr:tropomodulin-3 [Eurytemora carolleeae]|eukprot:XP_023344430.1 tropomodulin-3-like [Eurytemora affinis]
MSRTVAFGRDVLGAPDVDIEDLLACLSPSEVQALLDELASDPDDKHVPASVRTSYRCEKNPTGDLDRGSLITYIKGEAVKHPDKEEEVKFELGFKRGKVYEPKYTQEELDLMKREADIAEKVRLDEDEEMALSSASLEDIMNLADILNTNPQNFIREAYSDPLPFFPPEPPNQTNPKITDFAVSTLCLALEQNSALKSLNLESNRISPDTVAALFESLASRKNGILEVRISGQQQQKMGFRVESKIANAVQLNPRLLRIGIDFQFPEVINRVSKHLISNMDKLRIQRQVKEEKSEINWTPCRTIDQTNIQEQEQELGQEQEQNQGEEQEQEKDQEQEQKHDQELEDEQKQESEKEQEEEEQEES